jgi:hypothetical protein
VALIDGYRSKPEELITAPLLRAGSVPSLSRRPLRGRSPLGGTADSRNHVTTLLGFRAVTADQVEGLRCRRPEVAAALSMAAQQVGRYQSSRVWQSV